MTFSASAMELASSTWSAPVQLIRTMDMTTRYQIRLSTYMLCVLISALTVKGWLLVAWEIAGRPFRPEYVHIRHTGQTVAIDARLWPIHQLNPRSRSVDLA
jgi:hypothetical protein